MENQHRKITGYRELNEAEIGSMNAIKALGPDIERVIDALPADADARWVAIGRTHLQQG